MAHTNAPGESVIRPRSATARRLGLATVVLLTTVGPSTARASLMSVVAPTAAANALAVIGTAEPLADIDVTTTGGSPVCTTTAGGSGSFTCFFPSAPSDGDEFRVTATLLGNTSTPISVFVDDTPPSAPSPDPSNGSRFIGNAEASSTVRVRATPSGTELCVTTASPGGTYSCTPTSAAPAGFEVYAVDQVGNVGPPAAITFDDTAPIAPVLASNGSLVAGTVEPFATVTVIDTGSNVRCAGAAAFDGTFACTLSNPPAVVADLSATATDAAGNESTASFIAEDITAPAAPAINPDPTSTTRVAGTAEIGATVTASTNGNQLCTLVVAMPGLFDCSWSSPLADGDVVDLVTADPLGNQTASTVTVDGIGPAAPILVALDASSITMTVEPFSTMSVTGWTTTCPAPTGNAVTCTFSGTPVNGTVLSAVATDPAGNDSAALLQTVDTSAPAPSGLIATATTVTGTTQPSAFIEVRAGTPTASVMCSTTADGTTGAFSCTLSSSQIPGTRVFVVATNSFGSVSPAAQALVAQPGASIGVTLTATVLPGASTSGSINVQIRAVRNDNVFGSTINPVLLRVDGNIVASRLLTAGAAASTLDISPLALGSHDIELSYDGTTQFLPALAFATVNVRNGTAVTAAPITAVTGETVDLAVSVATSPPSANVPVGQVQFLDGPTLLGIATLDGSGNATLPNQLFDVGDHWITAAYDGDASFATSNAVLSVSIARASTTVALSAQNSTHQESQVLSAQVDVVAPGGGTPSGTVTFFDGSTPLGSPNVDPSGEATLPVALPVGSYSLTAQYNGDTEFADSVSTPANIAVGQAPVVVAATPDPFVTSEGGSANLSVSVTSVHPAAGTPSGTVSVYPGFMTSGPTLGSGTLDGNGETTLTLSGLVTNDAQINVVYDGDGLRAGSSTAITASVAPLTTTTTTTSATTTLPPTTTTAAPTTLPPTTTTLPPTTTTAAPTTTLPPTTTTLPPTTTSTTTATTTTATTTSSAPTTTAATEPPPSPPSMGPTTLPTAPRATAPPSARPVPTTRAPSRRGAGPRRTTNSNATTTSSAPTTTTTTTTNATIDPADTTTTTAATRRASRLRFLSPSPGQFPEGEAINIRVAVESARRTSGQSAPTGTVDIFRDDQTVCTVTLDEDGQGECADEAPLGEYDLTAAYRGDDVFLADDASLLDASDESDGPMIEVVPAADVKIAFEVGLGAEIEGATVQAWGDDLPADAEIVLEVHSTPIEVARFVTDNSGSFRQTFELPESLDDGTHRVVATLTPPNEEPSVADYEFALEKRRISELQAAPLGQPVSLAAPAAGSPASAYPVYDVAAAAPQVLTSQTELFALLALLGTSGSAMAAMALGGGAAAAGSARTEAKKRSSAKISGAGSKVNKFDTDLTRWGDRSRTWRIPGTSWIDARSTTVPHRISRWSPMLARTVQDGTYLRAAFGSMWLLVPVTGLALGIGAGVNAAGSYLPPALPWIIALLVVGVLDSFSGLAAGVAYVVTTAVIGGVPTLDGAQATAGLLALWFAPAVIAASTRPLRRAPAPTWEGRWERLCDAAMAPLWGAWGAQGIAWAQNGLSGRELPISDQALTIAVITFAALVGRFALETLASNLYPERLLATECGKFDPTSRAQQLVSLALKVVLFTVVGSAFFPFVWQFWVSAGFFVFGAVAGFDWIKAHLPNAGWLYRWMPGGLLKGILMVLIGRQMGVWLKEWQPDPARQVLDGMVYLAIPGLLLTVLALFSRDGERPPLKWWHRFIGIPLLIVTIGFKVGWF